MTTVNIETVKTFGDGARCIIVNGIRMNVHRDGRIGWCEDWPAAYAMRKTGVVASRSYGRCTYGHTELFLVPNGA